MGVGEVCRARWVWWIGVVVVVVLVIVEAREGNLRVSIGGVW